MDFGKIGKRIQSSRKKRGMSQAELAEKVEISIYHMSSIETGTRGPSLHVLISIAHSLGATTDYLLMGHRVGRRTPYVKEVAAIFDGCSEYERAVLKNILIAVSDIIRENEPQRKYY